MDIGMLGKQDGYNTTANGAESRAREASIAASSRRPCGYDDDFRRQLVGGVRVKAYIELFSHSTDTLGPARGRIMMALGTAATFHTSVCTVGR